MGQQEQSHKLAMIATLPEGELRGWWRYVCIREMRRAFDGERAALLVRARQLGIEFEKLKMGVV